MRIGVLLLAVGCATVPDAAARPQVVFFLGAECPVSNFYAPEMERLARAWPGFEFSGVYPEPDADAVRHARDYGLGFPVRVDAEAARAFGVDRVPQAVVLVRGRRVYRGRIDDRYSPDGKRRNEPRTKDLEEALRAVSEGRAPGVSETPVFGCPILQGRSR